MQDRLLVREERELWGACVDVCCRAVGGGVGKMHAGAEIEGKEACGGEGEGLYLLESGRLRRANCQRLVRAFMAEEFGLVLSGLVLIQVSVVVAAIERQ